MDREISKEEKQKRKRKQIFKFAGAVILIGGLITGIVFISESGIEKDKLQFATAERGTLESSVSASGKIVPLYEQAIVSPVTTQIMEIYCEEGDSVIAGQSLLKLDLESAETEMRKLADEVSMKNIEVEQTQLNNETQLTNLEMQIKSKEMSVSHLKAEVENEKRLDSIGSGTGDKIREAELAYSTAQLELEQMKAELRNQKKALASSYRSKQLESSISKRNLSEMERTIENAGVKAPKSGIVTYINKSLGSSIAAGDKLAVVSDLSHFKISAEIPESNANQLTVGSPVKIKTNRNILDGHIVSISPQSQSGLVEFNVILEQDNNPSLRSGLKANLNVVFDVKDDVVRLPNGQYFHGPGDYYLFVKTSDDEIERRIVTLGDSNFDFVEVKNGISPGETVVITDMQDYNNKKGIKLK